MYHNLKDIKEIYSDSSSCVKKVSSNYVLLLHPSHIQDIRVAVKNELNSMVKCYIKEFHGILMGYEAVKIVSPVGFLFHANVFLHVNIFADFYIFAPTIGSNLKGKVVKKAPNNVGCLVHGLFNASSSIPHSLPRDQWCGSEVSEGDSLEMRVTELNFTSFVPYVRGDILPDSIWKANAEFEKKSHISFNEEDSGISSVDNSFREEDAKKRKKKKKKEPDSTSDTNEYDGGIAEAPVNVKREEESDRETSRRVVKKEKKKKVETDSEHEFVAPLKKKAETDSEHEFVAPLKKKKKRKKKPRGETEEEDMCLEAIKKEIEDGDASSSSCLSKQAEKEERRRAKKNSAASDSDSLSPSKAAKKNKRKPTSSEDEFQTETRKKRRKET